MDDVPLKLSDITPPSFSPKKAAPPGLIPVQLYFLKANGSDEEEKRFESLLFPAVPHKGDVVDIGGQRFIVVETIFDLYEPQDDSETLNRVANIKLVVRHEAKKKAKR